MARVGAWWTSDGDRQDGDEEARVPDEPREGHARGTRDKHKIGHSIDLPSGKTEPVNYCADRAHPFRSLATLARPVSWKNNEATREPASSPSSLSSSPSPRLSIYHTETFSLLRAIIYFLFDFNMKFLDINWEFNTYIFNF